MAESSDSPERSERAMRPLYERLPRGPHRMDRGEVAENQRQRMHGAMIEAVAAHGYGGTSVKQVITLAGVSRRAFYEQFSNKQECFLTALELLTSRASERVATAYRTTDGSLEDRMRAALTALAELLAANPKSARMALLEAWAAGPSGWTTLTKALLGFERALAESFARTPGATGLPAPVVRGIVGGLHMMAFTRLHRGRSEELPGLVEQMLRWTLAFQAPAMRPLQPLAPRGKLPGVTARRRDRANRFEGRALAELGRQSVEAPTPIYGREGERMRLLDSVLEMTALEGYGNLSPLRIVDHADASIDTFFGQFGDLEGCALVALANVSEEVRSTLSGLERCSETDWPLAVRRTLHSLMRHLTEHPRHAHMLTTGAVEMGPPGIGLSLELASETARRLIAAAPSASGVDAHMQEGLAGAIWHTVYCHAACQKTDSLRGTADYLTYMVLASSVGAEQAAKILASELGARSLSRLSEPTWRQSEHQSSRAVL